MSALDDITEGWLFRMKGDLPSLKTSIKWVFFFLNIHVDVAVHLFLQTDRIDSHVCKVEKKSAL